MVRANQGGSVLNFVIIAVIMAIFLIGGVYIVRHQTAADVPTISQPKEPTKTEGKPAPETSQSAHDDHMSQENAVTPTPSSSEAIVLPQTGPSESISLLLVAGLVSAVGVSYFRSRRPELSL